jgi:hypothetical protein
MSFRELLTEGIFSKKVKDEDYDFAESVLINIAKKFKLKPKGKIIDKSGDWGFNLNIIQELKEPLTFENKIDIRNFLKKFKFKQNTAADPEELSGTFYADGDEFFITANYTDEKQPYLRIYTHKEGY